MTRENESVHSLKSPWAEHAHNVWLASVLDISRNLSRFKFPSKLDKARQEQTVDLVFGSLKKCDFVQKPKLYRAEEIQILDKEYLLEHFLATEDFYQAHGSEGFITDDSSSLLSVVNLKDHLLLRVVDTQQELEKSWNRLVKIEAGLSRELDFAYNSQFGFLTSDPRQCGTGLKIHLYLHIPATIHMGELSELLEREKEEEVVAAGLQGNVQEVIGDILVARNKCTLGLTEEYILTSMRMWATRAVVTEINLRKKLVHGDNEAMKNKITRALGLLTHSYQLELVEALNALSLVKLGVEIGWIEAPEKLNLNDVLFGCRRAHLIHQMGEKIEIPDLPKKRAQYLQTIAKTLKLSI